MTVEPVEKAKRSWLLLPTRSVFRDNQIVAQRANVSPVFTGTVRVSTLRRYDCVLSIDDRNGGTALKGLTGSFSFRPRQRPLLLANKNATAEWSGIADHSAVKQDAWSQRRRRPTCRCHKRRFDIVDSLIDPPPATVA